MMYQQLTQIVLNNNTTSDVNATKCNQVSLRHFIKDIIIVNLHMLMCIGVLYLCDYIISHASNIRSITGIIIIILSVYLIIKQKVIIVFFLLIHKTLSKDVLYA